MNSALSLSIKISFSQSKKTKLSFQVSCIYIIIYLQYVQYVGQNFMKDQYLLNLIFRTVFIKDQYFINLTFTTKFMKDQYFIYLTFSTKFMKDQYFHHHHSHCHCHQSSNLPPPLLLTTSIPTHPLSSPSYATLQIPA